MFKRIRIQNFKCLKDTEVELGPFTVLIGPNDSGKSSFLQVLEMLGDPQVHNMGSLVWQKNKDSTVVFEASGPDSHPFSYLLAISPTSGLADERLDVGGQSLMQFSGGEQRQPSLTIKGQHLPLGNTSQRGVYAAAQWESQRGSPGPISEILALLTSAKTYQLDPRAMREAVSPTVNPSLNPMGNNLAAVLHAMLSGPDRQAILDLETKLHEAIPTLKGISTPLASQNQHKIRFTLDVNAKPPITIPCSQASDGAMLITGFLVLVYGDAPRRLLIEEPENGLHPSRLKMVIDILRKISTGEIGDQPRQVIVTTHSPLLLNFVQPEEVRVFRRDEKAGTKVVSMDNIPNIAKLRKDFAPGELWYLFGEDELVKGKAS